MVEFDLGLQGHLGVIKVEIGQNGLVRVITSEGFNLGSPLGASWIDLGWAYICGGI